ncbi:MAG: glycosyltransferase [Opitutaceae bacterium]|nr:glycosyltransferase [Opitutaceae bacterium]
MRILLAADPILPVPPRLYGGIERIVARLAAELRARGHQVGLCALAESTEPVDALFPWPAVRVGHRLDTVRNAFALRSAVRDFQPDVVHSFARLAYLIPLLPSRLPKIMSYQRDPGLRQTRLASRWALGESMVFTGCSEHIAAKGRAGGGAWHAIPNFADTAVLHPDTTPPPADAPLVFLSRLDRVKAPHLAVAIARAAGRRLILAGNRAESGSDAAYFDSEVAPLIDGTQVSWVGPVDDTAKRRLLASAHALLVPVQWDEPFGIVFTEALACGCPVISCPRGALPEIVNEGVTGFLIRTVDEGAAAVARVPELSRAACRETAVRRFSPAAVAERYESLYRSLLPAD